MLRVKVTDIQNWVTNMLTLLFWKLHSNYYNYLHVVHEVARLPLCNGDWATQKHLDH